MAERKKLQVFVSSTYEDLKDERRAAVEAILQAGHIPAGMELFAAGDASQLAVIRKWIDESDVFLLILGGRYGSIEPQSRKSYVHLEYEYAIERGKPTFAIVIETSYLEERSRDRGSSILEFEHYHEMKNFRSDVLRRTVRFWRDLGDIKISIHQALSELSLRPDLVGWIRADQALVIENLAELDLETHSDRVIEMKQEVTRGDLEDLKREFQGRLNTMMSTLIVIQRSNPFAQAQAEEDKGYIAEAIHFAQKAYETLRKLPGNAKYTALNNLVYSYCLFGLDSKRDEILAQAREIRDIALKYSHLPSSAPYFLTFARAIAIYGVDMEEVRQALALIDDLQYQRLTHLQEREASFIAALLARRLEKP